MYRPLTPPLSKKKSIFLREGEISPQAIHYFYHKISNFTLVLSVTIALPFSVSLNLSNVWQLCRFKIGTAFLKLTLEKLDLLQR